MKGILLAVGGSCAGLLLGFVLWGRAERTAPSEGRLSTADERLVLPVESPAVEASESGATAEIERLRAKLAAEIARATTLADEVAALRDGLLAEHATGAAPERDASDSGAVDPSGPSPSPTPAAKRRDGWIDEGMLLGAGFDRSEVDALRARFEETELERLFIRDQATREGWLRTQRFRLRMQELQQRYDALREEFGDDDYDWILHAMGRPNRVVAKLVMQSSPAANAGLEPGDVILAYDGRKILGPTELQQATTQAIAGGTVAVDVEREGRELRFYLPAGPLGVQLEAVEKAPPRTR